MVQPQPSFYIELEQYLLFITIFLHNNGYRCSVNVGLTDSVNWQHNIIGTQQRSAGVRLVVEGDGRKGRGERKDF